MSTSPATSRSEVRPRRRLLRVLLVLGGLFLALAVAVWFTLVGLPEHPTDANRVRAAMARDLATGSAQPDVEEWLASHGITAHYFQGPLETALGERELRKHSLPPGQAGLVLRSCVRDTRRSVLVRWDLELVFVFDTSGRLIESWAKEVGTGL